MAFAIGITTPDRKSPIDTVNIVTVASMLFTSLFSIFFYILHQNSKPGYDHEKQPSNNLNMQFIAGAQVVSNILPKLMVQHVKLIFVSPTFWFICFQIKTLKLLAHNPTNHLNLSKHRLEHVRYNLRWNHAQLGKYSHYLTH